MLNQTVSVLNATVVKGRNLNIAGYE